MSPKSNFYEGEAFLQSLFTYFSYFAFDKAKEQADRERDASKNHASPVWITLLTCISQLATVEKLYMNLTFLTPKGFLRKESSVRLTYETILTELVEIEKRRATHATSFSASGCHSNHSSCSASADKNDVCSERVLLHISSHLILFIQARLLMLSFYEKLIICSSNNYVNYEEMLRYIDEIIKKNSSSFHHPVLAPIKTTFTYESEITSHLLGSLKAMQEWQFLPSLLHLHDAHSKLLSWQSLIQNKEVVGVNSDNYRHFLIRTKPNSLGKCRSRVFIYFGNCLNSCNSFQAHFPNGTSLQSKKYTFGSSFLKSSSLPALYQWLWSAKASFVSKFSLYFYEILSGQAPPSETRNLLAKLSCDYVGKIQNFQRKFDAQSVCVILKATGLSNLKVPGYCHPSEQGIQPSGIESYPAIFAYPVKPVNHWASIVMQISDRKNEDAYDRVLTIHDPKVGTSFFLCQIEPNLFLVVVFENKKPEKDNFVKEFLFDLALQLRCNKVFAALKPN